MSIPCRLSLDSLPPFWDRSVIFLSNIFSLFFGNHPQIKALHEEVGALETYGGRMVPILDLLYTGRTSLLVVDAPPDPGLTETFKRLGLSLPEIEVLPVGSGGKELTREASKGPLFEKIKKHPAGYVNGYVTDHALAALAAAAGKATLSSIEGCHNGNNKRLLTHFLEEAGLPCFETHEADEPGDVPHLLKKLKENGYTTAVLKSQIGASGIGMKKVDIDNPGPIPDYLFFDKPALIQGWLDESVNGVRFVASPSVLLFMGEEAVWIYDTTQQILSAESVHEGNVSPPPFYAEHPAAKDELIRQAEKIGQWVWAQGYRGTASVDFLVVTRNGHLEAYVCEVNARVTGATYPSILARKLAPGRTWLLRNVRFKPPRTSAEILKTLQKNGLLFKNGKNDGALPFNFNTRPSGRVFKAQFLFLADNAEKAFALQNTVIQLMTKSGGTDRD